MKVEVAEEVLTALKGIVAWAESDDRPDKCSRTTF
jgi:hypothetical protein